MNCPLGNCADTYLLDFGYTEQEIEQLGLVLASVDKPLSIAESKPILLPQRYDIHQNIPNERVVGCYNSNMVK